jgi:hypothetical protein
MSAMSNYAVESAERRFNGNKEKLAGYYTDASKRPEQRCSVSAEDAIRLQGEQEALMFVLKSAGRLKENENDQS